MRYWANCVLGVLLVCLLLFSGGCVAVDADEPEVKTEDHESQVDFTKDEEGRPIPLKRGEFTYSQIHGSLHDGKYTSPDRLFTIKTPELQLATQLIYDRYNPKLGAWMVEFSDHKGHFYSVIWGNPKGLSFQKKQAAAIDVEEEQVDEPEQTLSEEETKQEIVSEDAQNEQEDVEIVTVANQPPALTHEEKTAIADEYFLKRDQQQGNVKVLETYYDHTLLNGGTITLYQWEKAGPIMREHTVAHPDRPGQTMKTYEKLDRFYIAFTTVYQGKVVRLEIYDRSVMYENDESKLGEDLNAWTPERRKYMIHEIETWGKTLRFGNAIPVINQTMKGRFSRSK